MELVVDLERVTVAVSAFDDVDRLVLRVAGPADASAGSEASVHRLADVLASAYAGRLVSAAHALVRPDLIRFHAAGQVDDDWERRFAARWEGDGPAGDGIGAPVLWPHAPGDGVTLDPGDPGVPLDPGPQAAARGTIGDA